MLAARLHSWRKGFGPNLYLDASKWSFGRQFYGNEDEDKRGEGVATR